ncbi:alkaline phosphatase family protein [Desulfovibrio inopinatus]|uniref:alkaline phosphatase family protein n=1 Tax=Desulfovibrio inopinatus TaxID=102109 RepID=UPI00040F0AF4|nr:alkaline phosphatase family protein [Desulfovibrio inopinatus]
MAKRVIIIGLDGATFKVIRPLAGQGLLPNLDTIMQNGAIGVLESSLPSLSPVAWTSMITGAGPGKHGIFDFVRREAKEDGSSMRFTSGADRKVEPLWRYLSRHGKTAAAINVPMSYPPDPIDGIVVSGMDAPDMNANMTSPPEFKERLLSIAPNYGIELAVTREHHKKPTKFIEAATRIEAARAKVTFTLVDEHNTDFIMSVFTSLDRAQHLAMRDFDHYATRGANPKTDPVTAGYVHADSIIGEVMQRLDPDDTLLVVSDHGFVRVRKSFSMNKWLMEKGYLVLKDMPTEELPKKKGLLSKIASRLASITGGNRTGIRESLDDTPVLVNVDFSKTKAFSFGSAPSVFLNPDVVKTDEARALADEIRDALAELIDPDTGKPVFMTVKTARDAYIGPYADAAPHVIPEFQPGYVNEQMLLSDYGYLEPGPVLTHVDGPGGNHEPDGIFMAYGAHIQPGELGPFSIVDVMGTACHLLGVPVPQNIDGAVLTEILDDESVRSLPLRFSDALNFVDGGDAGYSSEEKKEIEDRLKSLGYL